MEKAKKAESEDKEDEWYSASGHVTWTVTNKYCTFSTYQDNAVSDSRFKPTEVLIENQADISIVYPKLLRNIMAAELEAKINGIGGHQFTVRERQDILILSSPCTPVRRPRRTYCLLRR